MIEHTSGGLAEHAEPIAAEWLRRGHSILVMSNETSAQDVRLAYKDLAMNTAITFGTFGKDHILWPDIDAMLNVIPGEPGPAFRDTNSRCDIPRCTINHGLTDKNTTFPSSYIGNGVGYNNVLLACGPAMFKGSWVSYVNKWPEINNSLKIIPVGCPKTDVLFNGTYQRNSVLETLGLNPSQPTVLYAPTYQNEASLESCGKELITALAKMPVNLLIRPHHLSQTSEWMHKLNVLADSFPNLRVITTSSNPLYVAADLLVGDASGASFEFVLQDKPVIFFDVPKFFAVHGNDGVGFWGRDAGIIAKNIEELTSAVMNELSTPANRSKARQALINQLVYHCGGAAQRAVDAILDMIEGRLDYPLWGPRNCLRLDVLLQEYIAEKLERCAVEYGEVALYGAGKHTGWLLSLMHTANQQGRRMPAISCVLDDQAIGTETFDGIPVMKPENAASSNIRCIILSSDYHQEQMRQRCNSVFGSNTETVDLYAPFPWRKAT